MKKLHKSIFIILLTFLFCACGTPSSPGQMTPAPQAEAGSSGQGTSTGETTHPSGFPMTDTPLTVVKYEPLTLPEEPADYTARTLFTDTYGSNLYIFACYQFEQEEDAYILYTYDTDCGKTESLPFSFTAAGYENLFVESMDVIGFGGLSFSFRISATHTKSQTEATLLYTASETGHYLSLKTTIPDPSEYPWNPQFGTSSVFDTPENGTYIATWNNETTSCDLYTYDPATWTRSFLTSLSDTCYALCGHSGDQIYYVTNRHIIQYDTTKHTGTCLASLNNLGLTGSTDCHLMLTSAQNLCLVLLKGHTPGIYHLAPTSENQSENEDEVLLHMVDLTGAYGMERYAINMAALLSTRSQVLNIEQENSQDRTDTAALRDRIIAEMVAGKGPDLLLVNQSDLMLLAQKGLLMDISPLLSTDTRNAMFSNIIDLGTVDSTFCALPMDLSYHTLFTSDTIWQGDSWTHEEVITLLENTTNPACHIRLFARKATASELLFQILLEDWSNSPFLDFEKGICYFDSEEFIQILELSKKHGACTMENPSGLSASELYNLMQEGEILASSASFYDGLQGFSSTMNSYGEDLHMIGFPDHGSQVMASHYLVVNARSAEYSALKEYLNFLLSYENQYTLIHPHRKDMYDNRLTKDPISGMYYMSYFLDNSVSGYMEPKSNGDSYLEDYLAFIESAAPLRSTHPDISQIVYDEFEDYLNSNKSAREAAAIIQNRVQLYLDENGE